MTRRELLVASAAFALTQSFPLKVMQDEEAPAPTAAPGPECRSRFCRHFQPDLALGPGRGRCGSEKCG